MIKKIMLVFVTALLLGGCTLSDVLRPNQAAKDEATASTLPSPTPDQSLEAMPATSDSSDTASLEADINNTTILEEDFTDLN